MKRSSPLRRTPITRKRRKPSETLRIYGPPERRAWVKAQACIVCIAIHPVFGFVSGHCHNAHTENGGKGRKADYTTIVPLCASHHKRYDEHQYPCDSPKVRDYIKSCAPLVEQAWRAHRGDARQEER